MSHAKIYQRSPQEMTNSNNEQTQAGIHRPCSEFTASTENL